MEFVTRHPTEIFATLHYLKDAKHHQSQGIMEYKTPGDDFHVYAAEWFPDRIDFYFDKIRYYTFKIHTPVPAPTTPSASRTS